MRTALMAAVGLILAGHATAEVSLPPGAPEGVRWAAERVAAATDTTIRCALAPDDSQGREGFRIRPLDGAFLVEAGGWPGVMYGLLELDQRALSSEHIARTVADETQPGMKLRAISRNIDLWLDIPLYSDTFRGWAKHDRSSDWWLHDRQAWRTMFRRLARQRLNGIVLLHPHIFGAFIDYSPRYPEATFLTADQLAEKQRALRRAIELGHEYNITLHWLRWNIWVPPGFARHHKIAQKGVDSELTRQFEAWCVERFYSTFPGFGSIISQCGEAPPGCAEFIREGTVRGLRRVNPRPRHIVWSWCANPPDVAGIIDAYDGETLVMNYLQYEQLFTDRADPRIGAFSKALGGAGMVALGGPKGAHPYLFWGSPSWAQRLMNTLHAMNGQGMVIEYTEPEDRWLTESAFAHYAWDPDEAYAEGKWIDAIAQRYGDKAIARPLLRAMESASRIIPRQVMLTHSQSGAFMPQLGLSMLQCLQMPSVSGYIFENSVETDGSGYLSPRMGKCWSSAELDWGESVLSIAQYAIRQIQPAQRRDEAMAAWIASRRQRGFAPRIMPADSTTPPQIADEIESLARTTLDAVQKVRELSPEAGPPLERMLGMLSLNARLGLYLAARDRAAIEWEVYRLTASPTHRQAAVQAIESSARLWRQYAGDYRRLHGPIIWGQVSTGSHPPPWSQLDLWYSYSNRPWDIDRLTAHWQREAQVLLRRLQAWPHEAIEPPVFDEMGALAEDAEIAHCLDFEGDDSGSYELITRWTRDVTVTHDPNFVLNGQASLLADSRSSDNEWNEVFAAHMPFEARGKYQVAIAYRVVAGSDQYRQPFAMALRTPKGGVPMDKGDARMWGARAGQKRERVMTAELADFDDYYLFLCIRGKAAIVVDDIRIAKLRHGR